MNKEERVLLTIKHMPTDYLPSHIAFSDKNRLKELIEAFGFNSFEELTNYIDNHFYYSYLMEDFAYSFRNDDVLLRKAENKGFCQVDWTSSIVYSNWGEGIIMHTDGFYNIFNPLNFKSDRTKSEKYIPNNMLKAYYSKDLLEAIPKIEMPELYQEDNFSYWIKDLKKYSGDYSVVPVGYWGIFERAYSIIGFENFMLLMGSNPDLLGILLDLLTDYKIKIAKEVVKLGFKVAHYGDDLGNQQTTFFSKEMFRRIIKPRMARLWEIYKSAKIPIIMHSCGNITEFIPDLIEIGLNVLEPVQPIMNLEYLKKNFGKELTFFGGIDTQNLLPFGTPEEVRKEASRVIRVLGRNGGYIIAPSQELMKDVPIENIKALIQTIKNER